MSGDAKYARPFDEALIDDRGTRRVPDHRSGDDRHGMVDRVRAHFRLRPCGRLSGHSPTAQRRSRHRWTSDHVKSCAVSLHGAAREVFHAFGGIERARQAASRPERRTRRATLVSTCQQSRLLFLPANGDRLIWNQPPSTRSARSNYDRFTTAAAADGLLNGKLSQTCMPSRRSLELPVKQAPSLARCKNWRRRMPRLQSFATLKHNELTFLLDRSGLDPALWRISNRISLASTCAVAFSAAASRGFRRSSPTTGRMTLKFARKASMFARSASGRRRFSELGVWPLSKATRPAVVAISINRASRYRTCPLVKASSLVVMTTADSQNPLSPAL